MTITATGLPDASAAVLQSRSASQAVSPVGVNDASALARQQLVTAVPAPVMVAAYAANVASPPKPALRNPPAVASSGFAAQFIAQTPGATQEDLQLFTVRMAPAEPLIEEQGEANILSTAHEEMTLPVSAKTSVQPNSNKNEETPAPLLNTTARQFATAPAITLRASAFAFNAASQSHMPVGYVKKPGISNARGSDAYAVASTRNASLRGSEPVNAEL